ncbi:TetR/AcrR family transcriptional regulator [Nocardia sp. IBHARD005]|uniref:TetR/AcrR family transcriptional regulator n=1 Tax=Nocardia sp. IBHARD005 TaxID=3457765 RepID=UPI0040596F10
MTLLSNDIPTVESAEAAARTQRRLAVLSAARAVFVANGYHGASMDDIAIRAGMSKPVLYTHYASKLDLYLAVLQGYLDRMVDGIRDALDDATGQEDKVRRGDQGRALRRGS